jgi:hypothetical protein
MSDGRSFDGGMMERGQFLGGPVQGLVGVAAEITGLSEDEVLTALEEGQTIAEIAEARGVDQQKIVEAAIAEAESRLQEALDNDRLTEEQMTQMLERLAEDIPERLEQPWQPGGPMGDFGQFGEGFRTMYDDVAEALGLAPEDLFAQLHDGKTLAEIAEEGGVEIEAVRDALADARAEAGRQAIEQAVEDGRMTQEQADWMIEGLEQGFSPGRGFSPGEQGFQSERGSRGRGMGW